MSRTAAQWDSPPPVPDDHFVDSLIYTDPTILTEEREKIFQKGWKFACHESELPSVGSYRTTDVAGVSVVVLRGPKNKVRAFVNACPHRGAPIVRDTRGTADKLTCFYHLWSFNSSGDCTGMTRPEGYELTGPKKETSGLRAVKVAEKLGLIFVSLNDDVEDFDTHVGDSMENVAEALGTVPLEVFHFHRAVVHANWKQWHETNMELYHEWGHVVNRATSIAVKGYHDRKWQIHKNGHGTMKPFQVKYQNYKGWTARDSLELPGLTPGEFRFVDLFPNTTVIIRATNIRIDTSIPIAPGLTIIEQRGLGVKGESSADREERRKHHNQLWGPLGRNLPEDFIFVEEVMKSCVQGASRFGLISRHEDLLAQDDEIMRAYYRVWSEKMNRKASDPFAMRSC